MAKSVKKKKKSKRSTLASLSQKEREALVRKHRQVFLLNNREKTLIDDYCQRNKIRSRSALVRKIVIERLLTELGENPPTLF